MRNIPVLNWSPGRYRERLVDPAKKPPGRCWPAIARRSGRGRFSGLFGVRPWSGDVPHVEHVIRRPPARPGARGGRRRDVGGVSSCRTGMGAAANVLGGRRSGGGAVADRANFLRPQGAWRAQPVAATKTARWFSSTAEDYSRMTYQPDLWSDVFRSVGLVGMISRNLARRRTDGRHLFAGRPGGPA